MRKYMYMYTVEKYVEYHGEVEKYIILLLLFFCWLQLVIPVFVPCWSPYYLPPPSLLLSHLNPTVYPKPADLTYVCMRECAYQSRL